MVKKKRQRKIYIVRYGEYSDQGIAGAFSSRKKAQYYCDIKNAIEEDEDYWVDDYILDEYTYPKGTQVVTYYTTCILKAGGYFFKAGEVYSEYEEKEVFSLPLIIQEDDECLVVSSITSLEHAKKVAYDEYYKWKAKQEGLN